ncbi:MAG: hypothetical protein KAS23_08890 [Anaerohalosphaera sp.]|nr:hypothetical protein [Anaerohalosphaera sp.]
MLRDPYYKDILERLKKRLDPELFERCACDLLRGIYPGLVPIRGGSDSGMDGAIPDTKGNAFPLVSTTEQNVIGNMTRSLESYLSEKGDRRKVVVATSQELTQTRRRNLEVRASELGFTLINVHTQSALAELLYNNPSWCNELLNLTGKPLALAVLPNSRRPLVCRTLIGREDDMRWLRETEGDLLITSQPGCGKTFLLYRFIKDNEGLFVIDDDITEVSNCIRSQQPKIIVVDDAHVKSKLLIRLKRLRNEIGADFRIFASCWPSHVGNVSADLNISSSSCRFLSLLTRSDIVKVINECGIGGPNQLIYSIVEQAVGKAGLATTLCYLCINGGIDEVATGDALYNDTRRTFENIVGEKAFQALAVFSLGGNAGVSGEQVAKELGVSLSDIETITTHLAAGGVLEEVHQNKIRVVPKDLRFILVREVFFKQATVYQYKKIISGISNKAEVLLTLIGAKHRGAKVPDSFLQELLNESFSKDLWEEYAWLGSSECTWVLENHSDKTIEITHAALRHVPENIIPALLSLAVNDDRQQHSYPSHPMRLIADWIKSARPGQGDVIKRRKIVFNCSRSWVNQGGDFDTGFEAMCASFSPCFSTSETVPGNEMAFSLLNSVILRSEMEEIQLLWPELLGFLISGHVQSWEPIQGLVHGWHYPGPSSDKLSESDRKYMKSFVRKMLYDLKDVAENHQGMLRWIKGFARGTYRIHVNIDPEFETLYPIREWKDWKRLEKEERVLVDDLAKKWSQKKPSTIVRKLLSFKMTAEQAGEKWSKWVPTLLDNITCSTKEPCKWIKSFLEYDADRSYIAPFLQQAIGIDETGWELYALLCFAKENLKYSIVTVVLSSNNLSDTLFDVVSNLLDELGENVGDMFMYNKIPEQIVKKILNHRNNHICAAIAVAEWKKEPEGIIHDNIVDDWRAGILKCSHDYWCLGEIFKADPSIAFDWMLARIEEDFNGIWQILELDSGPLTEAIEVLDLKQKEIFIRTIPNDWKYRKLIRYIVSDDLYLYKILLGCDKIKAHHLSPLKGYPNDVWVDKAKIALDNGHEEEDIVSATVGVSMSWSGNDSDMWKKWVDSFEGLLSDSDCRIRRIGEKGYQYTNMKMEQALKEERRESIYGR